jgi:hypothetical protein
MPCAVTQATPDGRTPVRDEVSGESTASGIVYIKMPNGTEDYITGIPHKVKYLGGLELVGRLHFHTGEEMSLDDQRFRAIKRQHPASVQQIVNVWNKIAQVID